MAGPYCGKDCESCALREQLSCSGCRSGPGRTWGTECELARCCQQKGHESCQTCSFTAGCRLFSGRNEQPQYRFQERERSERRQQEAAKKAEVLGKWLWILFWLMIVVQPVVGLMSDETVVGWFPQLYWPGQIASLLFLLADGAILLKISEVELSYRTAGICQIVAGTVNFVVQLFTDAGMESGWLLLVLLPVIVVSLVGQYHCYMGHAAVLYKVDDTLAGKWVVLWKWNIGMFALFFVSILLIFVLTFIAVLTLQAATIGMAVVTIVELVYLYRTAQRFRCIADDGVAGVQ